MAEFDKAPEPTQDPNWMFFSRPAREQPRANESKNILLEGSGKDLEEGAKLADSLQADNVKNKVFDIEQGERDKFISAASTLKQQQDSSQYADNSNSPGILSQNPLASAPPAVQQGVQQARSMQNAYDNGKMSTMQYHANVIPKLQALRHDYPGYRDVIDPALGNNANEYMQGLVKELNDRQSETKEEKNKVMTEGLALVKEGYFGANSGAVLAGLQKGIFDRPTLMRLALPQIQHNIWMKAQEDTHRMGEWSDADLKKKAAGMAGSITNNAAYGATVWPNAIAKGTMMQIGGAGSAQSDIDAIYRGAHNLAGVDENEQAQHQANLKVYYAQQEATMDKEGAKPMPGDRLGRSIAEVVGPTEWQAYKDKALGTVKAAMELVGDPKTSATGNAAANIVEHTGNMDLRTVVQDPSDLGQIFRKARLVAKGLGEQGTAIWGEAIMPSAKMGENVKALQQLQLMKMFGQPDPDKPSTAGAATKAGQDLKIDDPAYFKGLVKSISLVTNKDTSPEVKKNGLYSFFANTPENMSMLGQFNKDSYDLVTQRYINGADTMFQDLGSKGVVKEVIKQQDPELSKHFVTTMDSWFKELTSRNAADLAQQVHPYSEFKSRGVVVNKIPDFKYTWDNEHHELGVPPEVRQHLLMTRQRGILDSLDRFNMSLHTMGHVVEAIQESGHQRDFNAYMLELLTVSGLQATPAQRTEYARVRDAIVASGAKPKAVE